MFHLITMPRILSFQHVINMEHYGGDIMPLKTLSFNTTSQFGLATFQVLLHSRATTFQVGLATYQVLEPNCC